MARRETLRPARTRALRRNNPLHRIRKPRPARPRPDEATAQKPPLPALDGVPPLDEEGLRALEAGWQFME
ncbi:hypothetical protein [Methylobacterium sp. CM6257]|jgi:hypothetical protein